MVEIAALPAAEVSVKPLEWVYDEMRGVWSAQDGFGRHYTVSDSQWFHGSLSEFIWVDGGDEAAKAAAQADYEARIRSALTAQPSPDVAAQFDNADWYWRTMDPDDCGNSPEEAVNRGMLGRFCVCEIASSYAGPTRYGFIAPVLDPESDDEEFVHFDTHEDAIEAAKARAALARVKGGEA